MKDPIKCMKIQATDCDKTFADHTAVRGVVSTIYKELQKRTIEKKPVD